MSELSVAICTYNRAQMLPGALDSISVQTLPANRFEILVVDNGSTDNTREVVAAYQARRSNVHYIQESSPGIAHARNRAVREAMSEYIAFLDDDAWAEPQWLEELLKPIQALQLQPAPVCVVGPVLLEWEGGRPDWFPPKFETLLCRYDMGSEPCFLKPGAYLLTTNALFHRETFLQLGGFRPYLGRKRGQLLGGEDNDIFNRLVMAGHGVFYQPTARVHHGVPRERQTRRYLVRRLFWDGASQPLMASSQAQEQEAPYFPWREAYLDLRRCGRFAFNLMTPLLLLRQDETWDSLWMLIQRLGRLWMHLALGVGFAL